MQEKIKELENHINLLSSEISLLKSEVKSKSSVEHAETLADEAKGLAVMAHEEAKSVFESFVSISDKLYFSDTGVKSDVGNCITTELRHGKGRVHEYDKGEDFFVGIYQEKSPDKLVSAVYIDDHDTSLTIKADKITIEFNGGKN